MQQDQVFFAEHLDRVVDLGVGAHAGGENDRLAGCADVAEQVVVGQRSRGDLVAGVETVRGSRPRPRPTEMRTRAS